MSVFSQGSYAAGEAEQALVRALFVAPAPSREARRRIRHPQPGPQNTATSPALAGVSLSPMSFWLP
jgi:hypothetical protein